MILDPSAIVSVIIGEPGSERLVELIDAAPVRRMSAASYVELAAVVDGRRDPVVGAVLDRLLDVWQVELVPFTARQAAIARGAYQRFGRGSGHPARLNMGDCFAYALARDLGEPLLFTGRDFAQTDIELVTEPVHERRLSEILAAYGT